VSKYRGKKKKKKIRLISKLLFFAVIEISARSSLQPTLCDLIELCHYATKNQKVERQKFSLGGVGFPAIHRA
jgi:hypothetical protein